MATLSQLILLPIISFVSGFSFSTTGFGSAIIFHLGYWSLVSLHLLPNTALSTVVVYLTLSQIVIAMFQALLYRQYIRLQPRFSTVYLIFTLIATVLSIEVLVRNDHPMLTRMLGVMLLITFLVNFVKDYIYPCFVQRPQASQSELKLATLSKPDRESTHNEQSELEEQREEHLVHGINGIPADVKKFEFNTWRKYCALICACLASGFLRGLFGAGGPPMILYFLATDIDKRVVRALQPFALGYASGIPLIVNLLIIKKAFDASQWLIYLCMFIGFLFGLFTGNAVHRYVDQKLFRSALLVILFCGSINLMLIDLGNISRYSSLILMVIFLILLILGTVKIVLNMVKQEQKKTDN